MSFQNSSGHLFENGSALLTYFVKKSTGNPTVSYNKDTTKKASAVHLSLPHIKRGELIGNYYSKTKCRGYVTL